MTNYFTLTLSLKTLQHHEDSINKRLEIGRQMYNSCLNEMHKRYRVLQQSKEYQKALKLKKGSERNKIFFALNKKYGLTEYSLHEFIKPMYHHFKKNMDSMTAQKIATRCFKAFQKVMYHQTRKVKYKSFQEMNSLEGKTNKSGIRFVNNQLVWNGIEIPVSIKKNDYYVRMALECQIKFCRIVRSKIRGKFQYYIQLELAGIPPRKFHKSTGEIKNSISSGRVGIDIGTQTVAISSNKEVKLLELAPEINSIDKRKRILQRKLDRQRRVNNLNKYNENGTYKKGNKDKWIFSNKYTKTRNELAEIQRKVAAKRKQSHNILANSILEMGNKIFVENMNFNGLQRRSKETTLNEKTGRNNKKKRFGKSLGNKAPSMFLTILDKKLGWYGEKLLKIDTSKVKASQYNHLTNEYSKKALSERWNTLELGNIQRDLYSAYLIMNVSDNLKEIDRELCFENWENFKTLHDLEISRIKSNKNENRLISSMGV